MGANFVPLVVGIAIILIAIVLYFTSKNEPDLSPTSKTGNSLSGILSNGEQISYSSEVNPGYLIITNRRLLYCKKPDGWMAKGLNLVFDCSLGDVSSVAVSGLLNKCLHLSFKQDGKLNKWQFEFSESEEFSQRIIEAKNAFREKETIVAKTIIIEEANGDKPSEILQKRLARGEITLDEFHRLIQRT